MCESGFLGNRTGTTCICSQERSYIRCVCQYSVWQLPYSVWQLWEHQDGIKCVKHAILQEHRDVERYACSLCGPELRGGSFAFVQTNARGGHVSRAFDICVRIQACSIIAKKEDTIVMDGCSNKVISLKIGHALHSDVCMINLECDAFVATASVAMYGKCGSIGEAEAVFNDLSNHNLVSWTALLSANIKQGQGENALR